MTKNKIVIEQGQILEVISDNFLVNPSGIGEKNIRKCLLKKGEKIEIRFPFAWHFRTEDNLYFQADEVDILENCVLYGKVWSNVKFRNICSLEEILTLKLYEK